MNKQLLGRWVALIALVAPVALSAQTDPLFTHFTFNKLLYNPAYAGASGQYCLNAINHQQWLGYDDESPYIKAQDKQFGIENTLDAAR
ncbi:MAG: type IX secretion system membrane protein PorP/SprF, partial [Bacteroidia bacterium]